MTFYLMHHYNHAATGGGGGDMVNCSSNFIKLKPIQYKCIQATVCTPMLSLTQPTRDYSEGGGGSTGIHPWGWFSLPRVSRWQVYMENINSTKVQEHVWFLPPEEPVIDKSQPIHHLLTPHRFRYMTWPTGCLATSRCRCATPMNLSQCPKAYIQQVFTPNWAILKTQFISCLMTFFMKNSTKDRKIKSSTILWGM